MQPLCKLYPNLGTRACRCAAACRIGASCGRFGPAVGHRSAPQEPWGSGGRRGASGVALMRAAPHPLLALFVVASNPHPVLPRLRHSPSTWKWAWAVIWSRAVAVEVPAPAPGDPHGVAETLALVPLADMADFAPTAAAANIRR